MFQRTHTSKVPHSSLILTFAISGNIFLSIKIFILRWCLSVYPLPRQTCVRYCFDIISPRRMFPKYLQRNICNHLLWCITYLFVAINWQQLLIDGVITGDTQLHDMLVITDHCAIHIYSLLCTRRNQVVEILGKISEALRAYSPTPSPCALGG